MFLSPLGTILSNVCVSPFSFSRKGLLKFIQPRVQILFIHCYFTPIIVQQDNHKLETVD